MKEQAGLKVFVVDEDDFCLNMYQQYLANLGCCNVHIFSSASECLHNLEGKPDLIFVDHDMEEMKGVEVLQQIKSYNPDIYVVMISGHDDKQAAFTAQKNGAFDYILKGDYEEKSIASILTKINAINTYLRKRPG
ncbi:MAG: response regulator [Bacteroidetes bacterium]|nr:response regulator [Bacteroidota bacterium]